MEQLRKPLKDLSTEEASELVSSVRAVARSVFWLHGSNRRSSPEFDEDDLTQEMLIRLMIHLSADNQVENLSQWLFTVAKRILMDHRKRRLRRKRGSDHKHVSLEEVVNAAPSSTPEVDLLALDGALDRLSRVDPGLQRLVTLRFILGMTVPEVAVAAGISERTARRRLSLAKDWLRSRV